MSLLRRAILSLIAVAWFLAGDDVPRWLELNQASRAAIEARDYAKLRATLQELRPLLPGNPRVIYNLAASESVLGNRDAALGYLRELALMGLYYDIAGDEDFKSLSGLDEFARIRQRISDSRKPVQHSTLVTSLEESDLLPEDIAYEARSKRFFISSVRKCKIITLDGKTFATSPWPVLALRIDPKRRLLWAATGWVPHCERCDSADKDKSALLAFDLATGALRTRVDSPVPGLLGDMTIAPDGELFVSEGIHGAVLRLRPGAAAMERLDVPGEFPSPQTPALSTDGKTLYTSDYMRGIGAMDLANRNVRWLQPANGIALNGIDGLYLFHDSFIAVENGTNPNRIIRYSKDLRRQEILEANTPDLGEPTHGTVVGDSFYFLANTGWSAYDGEGRKKAGSRPITSAVRKIRLNR